MFPAGSFIKQQYGEVFFSSQGNLLLFLLAFPDDVFSSSVLVLLINEFKGVK